MAEITIKLRHNPKTGERELIIGYESEGDALPFEHEREHRALVEALLGRSLGELPEGASVRREGVTTPPDVELLAEPARAERLKAGEPR